MNPIALELLGVIVELLQSQQQLMQSVQKDIAEIKNEEDREVADDAELTPRLNELLSRLQTSASPALPEMSDM